MRARMRICLILLLVIAGFSTKAQKKVEREEQIGVEKVPRQVMDTIQPFLTDAHLINYYREIDGDHKNYEIKFDLNGLKYSVEFNDHHELDDVEVVLTIKAIPSQTRKNIESHFDKYDKFRIRQVQKQFSSETEPASFVIRKALNDSDQATIRYEIIADLKQERTWFRKELLFDSGGNFLSSREVIFRADDYILFR